MREPTHCATPTLLLAPRWPSPSWLMVATVLLGAGTLGLARVDNAPAVARIEKSFDADTIGRVRRGERGARNVALAVFSPSALAIGLIALYFFIARLAC